MNRQVFLARCERRLSLFATRGPFGDPLARSRGLTLVEMLVGIAILTLFSGLVSQAMLGLMTSSQSVNLKGSVTQVENALVNSLWITVDKFVMDQSTNNCSKLPALPGTLDGMHIGSYGAFADVATPTYNLTDAPSTSMVTGALARCPNRSLPAANSTDRLYFCLQLKPNLSSSTSIPMESFFFHSESGNSNAFSNAFVEVSVGFYDLLTGSPISCQSYRDSTDPAVMGTVHASIYWERRLLGAGVVHKQRDLVFRGNRR